MKITENLVKSLCNEESLNKICRLDLSNREINGTLDISLLKEMKKLTVLDISQNDITDIPESFSLPHLETLDCSDNNLNSLHFMINFKNCKQLYVDGNDNIKLSEKIKMFRMNRSVDYIDDLRRSVVDNFRERWNVMVKSKWEVLFAAKYAEGFKPEQVETVLKEFYQSLTSDLLFKNIHEETEQAMLKDLASEIVEKAQDGSLFEESNVSSSTPRSARLHHKWLNRDVNNQSSPQTSGSNRDTPKSGNNTPVSKPTKKRGRESTPTESPSSRPSKRARSKSPTTQSRRLSIFTSLKSKDCANCPRLPSVGDFDPVYFVRSHSVDNDPSDNNTKIWRCAFEPSIDGSTNQMLATCGGQNVCLIDCQTGKVMKRYKDNSREEDFYAIAWSTIPYRLENKDDKTNILAVAGNNGYIKLIHPSQFVMYAILEGHHDYISCLLFHPKEPTYLFSGSKDRKIILWDVGIPDLTDYSTNYKKLMVLNTCRTDALNLVYSPECQMLIAGCEKSCYGWRFNNIKKVSRDPDVEFMIPSTTSDVESGNSDDAEVVDGLALLPNGFIATKCTGSSHLIIWNLHDNLPVKYITGTKAIEVKISALLQYTRSSVDYINIGSNKGLLTVGDDKGSVYMYGMGAFVEGSKPKHNPEAVLGHSWKLEWPELDIKGDKEKMKELSDMENIVINSCCSSDDGRTVACGTDNNLVCIWKRNSKLFC